MADDPKNPDRPDKKRLKDNAKLEFNRKGVPRSDHAPRGSMGYGFRSSLTPGGSSAGLHPARTKSAQADWAANVIKKYRQMSARFNDHSKGEMER